MYFRPLNLQGISQLFEESLGTELSYSTIELRNLLNKPIIKVFFNVFVYFKLLLCYF